MTAPTEEEFEIFDAQGAPLGMAPRSRVHRQGLWHRAAHVWLFDDEGCLFLQQRAAHKDLHPLCWDFSVGEHLRPGESYLEGALRGLQEELGVTGIALQPLGSVRQGQHEIPALGIRDYEFTQSFSGAYLGPLVPDPAEVAQVRQVPLALLRSWVRQRPADFTPWFLPDARAAGLL